MADLLVTNFNFEITLLKAPEIISGSNTSVAEISESQADTLGDGGFQECSGLEIEMDIQEFLEGGRNNGVIQQIGRAKFQPIVLKRGMFFGEDNQIARDIWDWMQGIISGRRPVARYDGLIKVYGRQPSGDEEKPIVATWAFDRGLPKKIAGPQLNAKTGDIAVEELHIAHEGLRLLEA